jgi:hypothetical protein
MYEFGLMAGCDKRLPIIRMIEARALERAKFAQWQSADAHVIVESAAPSRAERVKRSTRAKPQA